MRAGDWSTARDAFEAALRQEDSAEAQAGLGNALWWLGETEGAVRHSERAYAAFRRRDDPAQAAVEAIGLYFLKRISLGNRAAARGWLSRVARLVDEFDLVPLTGWVALIRAHDSEEDPEAAERWARRAREVAARFGDADLELCALSQLGAALVQSGRMDEGIALLDEAMAGSLGGEGERLQTVVYASCNMISSCGQIAEVERARQWIRAADGFTRQYGSPHLYTLCRAYYGSVLYAIGDWEQAESEFTEALRIGGSAEPALRSQAIAGLAELRLAQGRVEEAERLLEGAEDQLPSTPVLAAVRLAQGEQASAAGLLRRRLRELDEGDDERSGPYLAGGALCLEAAALKELLSIAQIGLDRPPEAQETARRLADLGETSACEPIAARAERALGRVCGRSGEREAARDHLERAVMIFARLEMPVRARPHTSAAGGDPAEGRSRRGGRRGSERSRRLRVARRLSRRRRRGRPAPLARRASGAHWAEGGG